MFKLGSKSEANLIGVHPDLVRIVRLAITRTPVDFTVFEGARTVERERALIKAGKSSLKDPYRCRHVPTGSPAYAHAVDLVPVVGGQPSWNWDLIRKLAPVVKACAAELNFPLTWGGDWRTFKDGPHYELPAAKYP